MAIMEVMGKGIYRFGGGRRAGHRFHEAGMPGWTRMWHGYPCLHWSEMGYQPPFDRKQELEMLREEAVEIEGILRSVRERIGELETLTPREKG